MYETGLLVALLLWIWKAVWRLVVLNSQLQRNLRKVGMCLSLSTLLPRRMTSADRGRNKIIATLRYAAFTLVSLAGIVLSWGSVALFVGGWIYQKRKSSGAPVAVREFEWKMRNLDMSFEQVAREMYAMLDSMSLERPTFEKFKQDLREQVVAIDG